MKTYTFKAEHVNAGTEIETISFAKYAYASIQATLVGGTIVLEWSNDGVIWAIDPAVMYDNHGATYTAISGDGGLFLVPKMGAFLKIAAGQRLVGVSVCVCLFTEAMGGSGGGGGGGGSIDLSPLTRALASDGPISSSISTLSRNIEPVLEYIQRFVTPSNTSLVNLDSSSRKKGDPFSGEFALDLTNVVKLTLLSVEIPRNFFNVYEGGTNSYTFGGYTYYIPPGIYSDVTDLLTAMNSSQSYDGTLGPAFDIINGYFTINSLVSDTISVVPGDLAYVAGFRNGQSGTVITAAYPYNLSVNDAYLLLNLTTNGSTFTFKVPSGVPPPPRGTGGLILYNSSSQSIIFQNPATGPHTVSITVSDRYGNLLDNNGMDWSMTLQLDFSKYVIPPTIVNLDSSQRVAGSLNPFTSEFSINLASVTKVTLLDVEIPRNYFNYLNTFTIDDYVFTIPHVNYSNVDDLLTAMNYAVVEGNPVKPPSFIYKNGVCTCTFVGDSLVPGTIKITPGDLAYVTGFQDGQRRSGDSITAKYPPNLTVNDTYLLLNVTFGKGPTITFKFQSGVPMGGIILYNSSTQSTVLSAPTSTDAISTSVTDRYGNVLDNNGMDWSMSLQFDFF